MSNLTILGLPLVRARMLRLSVILEANPSIRRLLYLVRVHLHTRSLKDSIMFFDVVILIIDDELFHTEESHQNLLWTGVHKLG